jgi:hypothetical protein
MFSWIFYLSWNCTKSGSTILHTVMLLMRIVWSFVWRKFSSVGKGEWCDDMKEGRKLKLVDAHVTPINMQEVHVSKLGDAQGTPFFINKNIRSSFKTLYFYCFICYVLFLERLYFCFQFYFVLFTVLNGWIPSYLFWRETHPVFIA